ncbi:MAG: hypothetical protein C7B45_00970 [Sulfobacillus acidophilus]|uniref:Major facilitator superfamily (MFS) profile domain-containing protein n=1 Tax=Sulfobacillus acidophilus TaxID=53633 RepID=A0A2T2WNT1_9FIRM|nr:MAG: hypothetical protein C7B45_00970 [Sulfobacillus acidophilus]
MIRNSTKLFPIVFSQGMVSLAEGLLIPFVSLYLVRSLGLSPVLAGTILGVSGIGLILGPIVGGALADRCSPRLVIVSGLAWAGSANVVAAVTHDLWLFAFAYGLSLLASSSISPALYQTALKSAGHPLRSTATLIAVQNGAVAAGALVAWPLLGSHIGNIFVLAATVNGMGAILALILVGPSTQPAASPSFQWVDWIYLPSLKERQFWSIAAAGFLTGVLYSQMWSTVPTAWLEGQTATGFFALLWFLNGCAIFIAEQRVSRLLERYNPYVWMTAACLVYAFAVGLLNIKMSLITLVTSFVMLTLAELIYEPFPPTLYAKAAPLHFKARYQGAGNLAAATGLVIGPIVGELLLQWGGDRTVWSAMTIIGVCAALVVHQGRPPVPKDPASSAAPPHFKQERTHHDELA